MNEDSSQRYLSPLKGHHITAAYEDMYQQRKNTTDFSKQIKHGDVVTRSTLYSSVKCPHCDRMFAEKAALRHIPICEKIIAKPKPLAEKKGKISNITINILGGSTIIPGSVN